MIPKQVWRPFAILFGTIIAFLFIRTFFVPPSFGEYGHFRADAMGEIASRPLHYAGKQACIDCHEERVQELNRSKHASQSCETCHGPAFAHTEDPSVLPPTKNGSNEWCLNCHLQNPARPPKFPQVTAGEHHPGKTCIKCHNPHHPERI